MSLNLAAMLREAARVDPTKPVVLFDGGQLSYAELDALSDCFATGLRREGIRPADRPVERGESPLVTKPRWT